MSLKDWIKNIFGTPPSKHVTDKLDPSELNIELSVEVADYKETQPISSIAEEPTIEVREDDVVTEDQHPYEPEMDLPNYQFPGLDLLRDHEDVLPDSNDLEVERNKLIQTLRGFGIEVARISASVGPTVTVFELVLSDPNRRIASLTSLSDDIARSMVKAWVKVYSISENGTIGVETPNLVKRVVRVKASFSGALS